MLLLNNMHVTVKRSDKENNMNHSKLIFRISAVVLGLSCLIGCRDEKSVEMGPVETVEVFCKAVAAGEWSKAETLCDTLSMGEYIEAYKEAWKQFKKEDAQAMEIAKSILSNTTVTVKDSHKAEDKRIVTFTLEADGQSKTKKATVAKVEGAWRVERITETN